VSEARAVSTAGSVTVAGAGAENAGAVFGKEKAFGAGALDAGGGGKESGPVLDGAYWTFFFFDILLMRAFNSFTMRTNSFFAF
jgi:hypothetical protein